MSDNMVGKPFLNLAVSNISWWSSEAVSYNVRGPSWIIEQQEMIALWLFLLFVPFRFSLFFHFSNGSWWSSD
jgi:hypothetical protein